MGNQLNMPERSLLLGLGIVEIVIVSSLFAYRMGYSQAEIDPIRYPKHFRTICRTDDCNRGVVQLDEE
jgi:hypothetical protein